MALYVDAARVLEGQGGSLKSRVYGPQTGLKSQPAHVYALISECRKHDTFLKEVIENAGLLKYESKVTPLLALLLVHDLLLSKNGIAASSSHSLRQAIERHKARLFAECKKSLLHRKFVTVQALKTAAAAKDASLDGNEVRWVRVNALQTSVQSLLETSLAGYEVVTELGKVARSGPFSRIVKIDDDVPSLLAFPPGADLTKTQDFMDGKLVLQDKASCFPAYLLLEDTAIARVGDVLDACAAPGNKTTHLAALLSGQSNTVYACERNLARSATLKAMVLRANAKQVTVLAQQDFLALDPADPRFSKVTHLLLDPSCSGSGILGREDVPKLALPEAPTAVNRKSEHTSKKGVKRKHSVESELNADVDEENPPPASATNEERLVKLSNLQTQIIKHAFKFPAAIRVSYSTCSVNFEENEGVVSRALQDSAWTLLRRDQQVEGMKRWPLRGLQSSSRHRNAPPLNDVDLDACVRCRSGDKNCTMGFFVCCFVRRDVDKQSKDSVAETEDEEWAGFDNDD